jgi:hypothetical protein
MKGQYPKNESKLRHLIMLGEINENNEYELITTAKQTDSRYGDFRYTKADLEEMANNFNNEIVGTEIAVDLNHNPDCIALGWIMPKSMIVRESSKLKGHYSLYAKLHKLTPEGNKLMKTGAVRYFSLEIQHKFEKFIGSVKKTFKNVIRGLALTNRPVIKDMLPTFSEKDLIINYTTMNAIKHFLSQLMKQDVVSVTEKETLKTMLAELSDEEKTALDNEVNEVEAKPEEENEEEKQNEKEEENEDESKALSELKKEYAETKAQADKALTELRKRDLSEKASTMILSDDVKTLSFGFAKADQEEVTNFLMTLSDKQIETFQTLWSKAKAVDFSEKGYEGAGKLAEQSEFSKYGDVDKDSADMDAKIKAYMKKYNVSYEEALEKVS